MNITVRRRWKKDELAIARLLGGEREPVPGRQRGWRPDVNHDWLAIEVKSWSKLPASLTKAMDQAVKAAEWFVRKGQGQRLPIAVIHGKGMHFDNSLVIMKMKDFRSYFGDQLPQEEESEHEGSEAEGSDGS